MSENKPERTPNTDRRTFLKAGGMMTAAALGSSALSELAEGQKVSSTRPATSSTMPTRNLGKTGQGGNLQPGRASLAGAREQ